MMKEDIMDVLVDFHRYGRWLCGGNGSFIILIPNCENSNDLYEYRQISLVGSLEKIMSKVLANGLKNVLIKMIDEAHNIFLG